MNLEKELYNHRFKKDNFSDKKTAIRDVDTGALVATINKTTNEIDNDWTGFKSLNPDKKRFIEKIVKESKK